MSETTEKGRATGRGIFVRARRLFAPSRAGFRASHRLAHLSVCAALLCAWSLPPGAGVAPRRAVSEDEIDAGLQRAARAALAGRDGTVLVLDAQTGRLRADVNSRLAFEEAFPPGSAVKPFTTLAALGSGAVDEHARSFCPGRYERAGLEIRCSHPRLKPPFNLARALAYSCNHFYARVGEQLDGDAFARALDSFGFGTRTGAGGEREVTGRLPRAPWRTAYALGDSPQLLVTPAQLVAAYAALFNGGRLLVPRRGSAAHFVPEERARVGVEESGRALLVEGMRGAIAYGTAERSGLAALPQHVFGKTGTATATDDFRTTHGWFVGLASDADAGRDAPPSRVRLAVLVFLKHATGGDSAAAARPVFDEFARLTQDARPAGGPAGAQTHEHDDGGTASQRGDAATSAESSLRGAGPSSNNAGASARVRVRVSRADAVLSVPVEDYVFGVVAAEGSVENEPEALKALAVVARTYAARNLNRHARDNYDLCDTTHCQRFVAVGDAGARPDFYALARRAVSATAGETMRDRDGRVAESYFSADCGGATADLRALWGAESPAHLRGGRDEFCAAVPGRNWSDAIPARRLAEALRSDRRTDVGARLDHVRVLRRDPSGRAELLALEGERRRVVRGWDFKIVVGRTLGWNVIKSTRFDVSRAGANFVFRGTGFGHGLGLCQAGARVMARRGATYRQILAQYLPGAPVAGSNREAEKTADGAGEEISSHAGPTRGIRRGLNIVWSPAAPGTTNGHQIDLTGEASRATRSLVGFAAGLRSPRACLKVALEVVGLSRAPLAAGASRARGLGQRRLSLSSGNFRASYPAGASRREVEAALAALEAARADVSRRLESAALNAGAVGGVELFVHASAGDFAAATGQPVWAAAVTRGRRIDAQPLEILRRRGVLSTTLRHEYVHAVVGTLGAGRAPRWLSEGLAVHVAGEAPALARHRPRRPPPLAELEQKLAAPASAAEMRALYYSAYAEVAALIRREGEPALWRRALRG